MSNLLTRAPACPPWCAQHYPTSDSGALHYGAPRAVTGASSDDDSPVSVAVWAEVRDLGGVRTAVGVLEKKSVADAELCPCALRTLAGHLLAVADLVEAVGGVS